MTQNNSKGNSCAFFLLLQKSFFRHTHNPIKKLYFSHYQIMYQAITTFSNRTSSTSKKNTNRANSTIKQIASKRTNSISKQIAPERNRTSIQQYHDLYQHHNESDQIENAYVTGSSASPHHRI